MQIETVELWRKFRIVQATIARLPILVQSAVYWAVLYFAPPQIVDLFANDARDGQFGNWIALVLVLVLLTQLQLAVWRRGSRSIRDVMLAHLPFGLVTNMVVMWETSALVPMIAAFSTSLVVSIALTRRRRAAGKDAGSWAATAIFVILVLTVVSCLLSASSLSSRLGPLGIGVLGVGLWTLATSALVLFPGRAIVTLAAFGIVGAVERSPDVTVPMIEGTREPPQFFDSVYRWLGNRPDLAAYRSVGRPYPVIISSAEGGGIYAAAHAYYALTSIAATCPALNAHLFASVGVSGGAVGTALFAATPNTSPMEAGCAKATTNVLPAAMQQDFLGPVVANLLIVQPFALLTPGDQQVEDGGSVLAQSFISGFADLKGLTNGLGAWQPNGNIPLQVYVATDVAQGRRVVMSGLSDAGASDTILSESFPGYRENVDISAIDAAVISARFPWLTSTARIKRDGEELLLADGGYYDNSGAETAWDIAREIANVAAQSQTPTSIVNRHLVSGVYPEDPNKSIDPRDCPLFIHQRFDDKISEWGCGFHIYLAFLPIFSTHDPEPAVPNIYQQSYTFDPIRTLTSVAASKARLVATQAEAAFGGTFPHELPVTELGLPLGWKLSGYAAHRILDLGAPMLACNELTIKLGLKPDQPDPRILSGFSGRLRLLLDSRRNNGCNVARLARLFYPKFEHQQNEFWIPGL